MTTLDTTSTILRRLDPTAADVLLHLQQHGPATAAELGAALLLHRTAARHAVHRLGALLAPLGWQIAERRGTTTPKGGKPTIVYALEESC